MENHAAVVVRLDLNTTRLTAALERSKGMIQLHAIDELYERFGLEKNNIDNKLASAS